MAFDRRPALERRPPRGAQPAERVTHRAALAHASGICPGARHPRTRGRVFVGRVSGITRVMASDAQQHISMLRILYATCKTSLDAFHAADNPVDGEFVAELERITERTFQELKALAANSPSNN